MSKVSICVPAYHAEQYFSDTLESVRSQTFTDWELVVTEDGSKDRTEELVRAFATSLPQSVKYHWHAQNKGLPATRNTGLSVAGSEWIAILDADDLWHPEHLSTLLETAEKTGAALAFSSCRIFDSATNTTVGTREACAKSLAQIESALFTGELVIQPSTVLFRHTLAAETGQFDAKFPICNDLEFWIRALRAGYRFAHTGRITCDYRKHANAMSGRSAELIEETGRVYWKHRNWSKVSRQLRRAAISRQFLSAARMYVRRRPLHALRLCGESALGWLFV
jgi:glycosyltransferase involved in cell wall biosynthesis